MLSRRYALGYALGIPATALVPRSGALAASCPFRSGSRAAVASAANLQALLDDPAVDDIVLAPGTYAGSYTMQRGGTCAQPVRLRPKVGYSAVITGRLSIAGDHVYLNSLKFDGGTMAVTGANARVGRIWFTNNRNRDSAQLTVLGADCTISNCLVERSQGRGICIRPSRGAVRALVTRCHFRNFQVRADDANYEALQLGTFPKDSDVAAGAVVEFSLFENINADPATGLPLNGEVETICIKSSGNVVRCCHLRQARAISLRHGERNLVYGCRVEGKLGALFLQDRYNTISDSTFQGAVAICAGDVDPGANGGAWYATPNALRPAAAGTQLIRVTTARPQGILIGHMPNPSCTVPARGTRFYPATMPKSQSNQASAVYDPALAGGHTAITPVTLAAGDVGLGYGR